MNTRTLLPLFALLPGLLRADGFFDPQLDEKCDNEEVYE